MKIGYARVSTQDQHLERQMDQLKEEGCEVIYSEKMTGTTKDRPELEHMLKALRPGDTVVVAELSRLSRKTKDILSIVDEIHNRGADVKSLKETWLDTTTPHGALIFTIFSGLVQFERDLIRERTIEGLQAARARGRKGGRKPTDAKVMDRAIKLYDTKTVTISEIKEMTGVSKSTLYDEIRRRKVK